MVHRWIGSLIGSLMLIATVCPAWRPIQAAPSSIFTVNSDADVNDGAVGNSLCETAPGNGICTLRAAIQEASANPSPDTIIVPAETYVLGLAGQDDTGVNGDLDITGTVTIQGAGPVSTVVDGGAIIDRVFHVINGSVTISGITIRNGTANNLIGGGGILNEGRLTLSNTVITGNRAIDNASQGGGITNLEVLTLDHSIVSSNTVGSISVAGLGAGVYDVGDSLAVNDSVIQGNTSTGNGGGLFTLSQVVTVTNTTVNDNEAANGGAILNLSPSLKIINSTLSGNVALGAGGGIYVVLGNVSLYNVTVSDNLANAEEDGDDFGGGIAREPDGALSFINSILAGNRRIDWSGPTLEPSDCAGTLSSLGPNFVGETANPCTIVGTPPITGGFALLGPLADHGGLAPTHALLPGSPAIDAGAQPNCTDLFGAPLTRDQRGVPRPLVGQHSRNCDLGAYEYVGPLFFPLIQR